MTRLNKFLGESGLCSRREADALIAAGRVRVNGVVAGLGVQVGEQDRVELDGRLVRAARPEQAVYIAYNKPVGVVCVTDRREPANIIDAVRHPRRIFPVGRLDKPSEGLIFLTSDGDVVNKVLRAGNAHEKEYDVRVNRPLDAAFTRRMSAGVPILDTVTRPCRSRRPGATASPSCSRRGSTARFGACASTWATRSLGCGAHASCTCGSTAWPWGVGVT